MSTGRINLGDLKSQIDKRVGADRARQYFGHLNQLLSQKLSKPEFNKLLLLTLGCENLHLHNQLVQSVFQNACQAKTPPPRPSLEAKTAGPRMPHPPVWSNEDVPQSLRRSLSGLGGRRIKDRPSPLGLNSPQLLPPHEETVRENGVMGSFDLKRPLQHHEGAPAEQPAKRPRRAENSSEGLVEMVDAERERDDSEMGNYLGLAKFPPLQAPLGIPFCPPSIGGARRNLAPAASSFGNFGSCSDSGELSHTEDLRRRMERIAEGQGLGGVALDCANLLNNGLNAYLKRLIKSSIELLGTRSGRGQMNQQQAYKHQIHGKPINGVWQGNHIHLQGDSPPIDGLTDPINRRSITMQDFRVAMELNPHQLGEDWPLLLEKICHHLFEE